ncbi:MAG: TM1812 family CRISPR-associated protein [Campylobacter sp.]|nr:TM1812 family CRISPR-associated protein [Campylobacter sp.]
MKEKAVITILGTSGDPEKPAQYIFFDEQVYAYANTLPMLLELYGKDCDIIAFYTKDAKIKNSKILNFYKEEYKKFANLDIDSFFKEKFFIQNENDFTQIFAQIDQTISDSKYDKIIIDVSHGFRHLPILMTIDMIIQNFSDPDKIEKIIFTKEVKKYEKYEIIDLKEYLDLANIAFILTAFNKNYTVANHIKSTKYPHLIDALQDFSDDIMALNI